MATAIENVHDPGVETFPTRISDLHFSSATHNFSSTLVSLKRSALSTHNRLRSIQHDSQFVHSVASKHHLPLIANERCGSWYIPPESETGSAYFKSTDGHFGEWTFSLRRLNLQILEIIGAAGGCVLVDSTRRGKSMPDALSKTVPIWCAVINRLLFPERSKMHQLHTPARAVSVSEHAQIEARLVGFAEDARLLRLDTAALRAVVKHPLLPSWITPDFEDTVLNDEKGYNHIICCTASRRVEGSEASESGYIQGAADDHESWSQGLTSLQFWKYRDELLEMAEEDIGDFIDECRVQEDSRGKKERYAIKITSSIYIASLTDSVESQDYDALIRMSEEPLCPTQPPANQSKSDPSTIQIQSKPGKLGSRDLRTQLSSIISFVTHIFSVQNSPTILVMCHDGKDLSVGVALAILCLFYDDEGECITTMSTKPITKIKIRQRLATITLAKPDASPSRATLQSVHAFLMS